MPADSIPFRTAPVIAIGEIRSSFLNGNLSGAVYSGAGLLEISIGTRETEIRIEVMPNNRTPLVSSIPAIAAPIDAPTDATTK